jgi:hypothetical protein
MEGWVNWSRCQCRLEGTVQPLQLCKFLYRKGETCSNRVFGVERAVDIIVKRVKTEGKKDDFDRLCTLIVSLIDPWCAAFPAHLGFCCARH